MVYDPDLDGQSVSVFVSDMTAEFIDKTVPTLHSFTNEGQCGEAVRAASHSSARDDQEMPAGNPRRHRQFTASGLATATPSPDHPA
jgi:hypothetical protein